MRPQVGLCILAGLFVIFAGADLVQLTQAARGQHPDPPSLLVVHAATGLLAAAAAVATWRLRRFAPVLILAWGGATAAMLIALGPILATPVAERSGLWTAAAAAGAFVLVPRCTCVGGGDISVFGGHALEGRARFVRGCRHARSVRIAPTRTPDLPWSPE